MKKIVPMNMNEFADYLCQMKEDETVEFGTDAYFLEGSDEINPNEVECWYFARIFWIEEYCSHFLLIDFCGGESAFVIPLNCYSHKFDSEDVEIVRSEMPRLFSHLDLNKDSYVFVEMEEPL